MNERFAVPGVGARTLLGEAAPALLLTKAEPLFELESAARGGADMDAVHDMRVASRRMRETMRLLAPIYPSRGFAAWYKRVRHITRTLGPVRDSDVFIDDFSRMGRNLNEGGRRAIAFMVGYRMGLRERELETLNRELAQLDLETSRASFAKLAKSAADSPDASRPLADFAHASVAERAATVFGAQPVALEEANMLEQHALRIDYKRLRYAVEVFAPCYGDDFDAVHAILTAFQDTLGNLHDVHLFADIVRDPAHADAAKRAGVSADDLAQVADVLDQRAHREYLEFCRLASESPPEKLLPMLLLPLTKLPASAAVVVEVAAPLTHAAAPEPAPVAETRVLEPRDEGGVPTLAIASLPLDPAIEEFAQAPAVIADAESDASTDGEESS